MGTNDSPEHFIAHLMNDALPLSGPYYYVYRLGNSAMETVWVGYTKNLPRRLYDHWRKDKWADDVWHMRIERRTQSEDVAKEVTEGLREKYNVKLKRKRKDPDAFFEL